MNENTLTRQSPLHALIASASFPAGELQAERAKCVGLCDQSLLEKWGLRGSGAAAWLASQGIDVPDSIYASNSLSEGGLIVRVGDDEFFLEAASTEQSLAVLRTALPERAGCTAIPREEAAFLLTGHRSRELLAQTCGHPLADSPAGKLVFTRVAGVSCGVLPQRGDETIVYRLWLDPSFAIYLWETLLEIALELGGGAIESV